LHSQLPPKIRQSLHNPSLFLEEGVDAVKRMYPEYVAIVESHIGKSKQEVKKELPAPKLPGSPGKAILYE
jgi:hypothetical protein